MPEMHLEQMDLFIVLVDPLQKQRKNSKIKKARDKNYIYKNELDEAYFQHDMAYGDFKDLARRTTFDKILRGKSFNISKNPKYDGYQRSLAAINYKLVIKSPQVAVLIRMQIMKN